MVIEGFCIEMSAKELVAHLHARAKGHEDTADAVAKRVRAWVDGDGPPQAGEEPDPDDVQFERDRARELRFLAEHIAPDTNYRLDTKDLAFLEIVERSGHPRRRR